MAWSGKTTVCIGSICNSVLYKQRDAGNDLELERIRSFILVFEVFAYQARYQINDLRDIGDDRDSDDRLFPKGVSKNAYIIELSAILAGIKII